MSHHHLLVLLIEEGFQVLFENHHHHLVVVIGEFYLQTICLILIIFCIIRFIPCRLSSKLEDAFDLMEQDDKCRNSLGGEIPRENQGILNNLIRAGKVTS